MNGRYATPEEQALAFILALPALACRAIAYRLPALPGISTKRLGQWRYLAIGQYRLAIQIRKV